MKLSESADNKIEISIVGAVYYEEAIHGVRSFHTDILLFLVGKFHIKNMPIFVEINPLRGRR